jgi:dienelactone hydrolase
MSSVRFLILLPLLCTGCFRPSFDYSEVKKNYGPHGPKYGTHKGSQNFRTSSCTQPREFLYYEPEGTGPAPIAIILPGTIGNHRDPMYHHFLQKLAAKGYVAVSVDYGQFLLYCAFYCGCYKPKTDCMFDASKKESLISVLARTTRGDPSLGIVVWGHSQGGYMAIMSGDLNPNIRRVVATGTGDPSGAYPCICSGQRKVTSEKIRFVIGEHDEVTPPRQPDDKGEKMGIRRQLTKLTEQPESCNAKDTFSCFRPNGSGFYILRGSETADGRGDHQFWNNAKAKGDKLKTMDSHYMQEANLPWSLDATIDWLTGACGNGVCDKSENVQTCSMDCKKK